MDLQYLREEAEAWLEYYIKKSWTRNPMEQLYRDYFYFHFYNLHNASLRFGCYICYHVEGTQTHLPMPFKKGVFENQFYPKKRRHTELCFISWFRNQKKFLDKMLSPGEKYRVTWYMSWSPCINCANAVVRFLEENENADWRIFVARLYHSNSPEHRLGLRRLHHAGVQMNIMSSEDFEYCWETFVDHQGTPFFPWDDMDENYERLSMTLEDILQNQEN